ncbi:VOC family protein [Hymenobacter metallicola]|uniref:VOC family protein n=1 Tax=Hymenobacter metallicola TaxID=2563114 RepID=A0A4Z0QFM9_9BACT|nr:VOC family protein [Hymenobacter metallicola]TGE28555.1 VOC family protein [Hymenobacter metallicola]
MHFSVTPALAPVLRVARPTNNIAALRAFYQDGLGFELLAEFENHNGFDGIILGHRQWPYHFEFTHQRGHRVPPAPSQDNLLVFYFPDAAAWQQQITQLLHQGYAPLPSYNPYWDTQGKTFADADGYRIVLQQSQWKL